MAPGYYPPPNQTAVVYPQAQVVYGAPSCAVPVQARPAQQARPAASGVVTASTLAEHIQMLEMLNDILGSIDPTKEDCTKNDIVKEMLTACTKFQSGLEIEKLLEKGLDDSLLNQILLFNDKLLEINNQIEHLHQIFVNPMAKQPEPPKPQQSYELKSEISINLPGVYAKSPIAMEKVSSAPAPVNNSPPPVKDEFDDFFDQIATREKKTPINVPLLQLDPQSAPQPIQLQQNPIQSILLQPNSNLLQANPLLNPQANQLQPNPNPLQPNPLQPNSNPLQANPLLNPQPNYTVFSQPQNLSPSPYSYPVQSNPPPPYNLPPNNNMSNYPTFPNSPFFR